MMLGNLYHFRRILRLLEARQFILQLLLIEGHLMIIGLHMMVPVLHLLVLYLREDAVDVGDD